MRHLIDKPSGDPRLEIKRDITESLLCKVDDALSEAVGIIDNYFPIPSDMVEMRLVLEETDNLARVTLVMYAYEIYKRTNESTNRN